jgi:hypothetical protein
MADSSFVRRFEQQARSSPRDFAALSRQELGHPPHVAAQLLAVHRSLLRGEKISPSQAKQIQAAFPQVGNIGEIVGALNAQEPGQRPPLYLAALAGDAKAISGDFAQAGDTYRRLESFAEDFHRESIAAEIAARREVNVDRDIAAREIKRPEQDPLSVRAQLESQWGGDHGRLSRQIADGVNAGDPTSLAVLRGNLADKAESAIERLKPESQDSMSLRDVVSAAADLSEVRELAADQFGIGAEDQS